MTSTLKNSFEKLGQSVLACCSSHVVQCVLALGTVAMFAAAEPAAAETVSGSAALNLFSGFIDEIELDRVTLDRVVRIEQEIAGD